MAHIKRLLRAALFVAATLLVLASVQHVFIMGPYRHDKSIALNSHDSFRSHEPSSLDVVYVGASNVFAFWQPALAWTSEGITSQVYTNGTQPDVAIRHLIQECRKTQPNALYIVNINNFKGTSPNAWGLFHLSVDDLPLSREKVDMVNDMVEAYGLSDQSLLDLLFPLYRYHARWSELQSSDFVAPTPVIGGLVSPSYFAVTDETEGCDTYLRLLAEARERQNLGEVNNGTIIDLLDYCDQERVRILFVLQPQALTNSEQVEQIVEVMRVVEERGYDIVDLSDPATTGLIPSVDFRDYNHVNLHGSIKYTNWLAHYVSENYGIADKRGGEQDALWNAASSIYENYLMTRSVMDYELSLSPVRTDLAVSGLNASSSHQGITLTWNAVDGSVDNLIIYRRLDYEIENPSDMENVERYAWKPLLTIPADQAAFFDALPADSASGTYAYRVIPITHDGDVIIYGSYAVPTATADWEAPAEQEGVQE